MIQRTLMLFGAAALLAVGCAHSGEPPATPETSVAPNDSPESTTDSSTPAPINATTPAGSPDATGLPGPDGSGNGGGTPPPNSGTAP